MLRINISRALQLFAAVAFMLASASANASNWLFRNGKSNYQIVVSAQASTSEQKAASELQQYIKEISGAELPGRIFVGYNDRVAALTGEDAPQHDDESFTYRTMGHDLLIWGGAQRGTMYGVFTFLERELGVHWLTPDCTVVPKQTRWRLPVLDHSESPAIQFRYHDYRYTDGKYEWGAHVKENMRGPVSNEYGNEEGYWGCHTMGQFVTPKEFYDTHPEYFSLRDGKRLSTYAQLCLSNPEVLELCKTRLMKVIREHPGFRIYSLSQNDNQLFCQCEKCQAIEAQYGGHAGIVVWFVNQVADAVRQECDCLRRRAFELSNTVGMQNESFEAFNENVFPETVPDGLAITQRKEMVLLRKHCEAYADRFPEQNPRDLLLYGPSGLGKSYLLHCIARRLQERGFQPELISSYDVIRLMRDAYFGRGDDTGRLYDADILLIDDLGMEPLMENVTIEQLFQLVNVRRSRGLAMVFSTNLKTEEIKARYTERLASRLLDRTLCQVIQLSGEDIRQRIRGAS